MKKTLVVLLGPTGVGKTDLSINIAKYLNTYILSSDSRQFYKELRIGTAVPSAKQLGAVPHYFIHNLSLHDYFNVSMYEQSILKKLKEVFQEKDTAMLVGGSGMYIDVVCNGIDELPDVDPELRAQLQQEYEENGLESIRAKLKLLDPIFYDQVDLMNYKRVLKAVEVCLQTGKPYSSLRTQVKVERDFDIVKIGLNRDREELYERINLRVDQMIDEGLVEEARKVYPHKGINALNTVGYKELFEAFDGNISEEKAIELIKRNSRRYAKRQLTWWGRDKEINWFNPNDEDKIFEFLKETLQ